MAPARTARTLTARPVPRDETGSPPPISLPIVSAVIVNYRQWSMTAQLARAILNTRSARRGRLEVIIVDNHAQPDQLAGRLRRWPGVSLRRWQRNRGFARAANEGCRLSRGQWLLLRNPDVTLHGQFLDGLLGFL